MFHKLEPKLYYHNQALNKRINEYEFRNLNIKSLPIEYMKEYIPIITSIVLPYIRDFKNITFCLGIRVLKKHRKTKQTQLQYITTKIIHILNIHQIEDKITDGFIKLHEEVEDDKKTK